MYDRNPYLVPMTLADLHAMIAADDPLTHTRLDCPAGCNGTMNVDLEPIPAPASLYQPMALATADTVLQPVIVCTTCGYATTANYAIYGPRDTTSRAG